MHTITGSPLHNAAQSQMNAIGSSITSGVISHQGMLGQVQARRTMSKKIFSGNIEVQQVSNGYVVNIGTKEGYEYTTHIAQTITEVNEIIAAAMVAFQLEK
jgi:hypothetical protein